MEGGTCRELLGLTLQILMHFPVPPISLSVPGVGYWPPSCTAAQVWGGSAGQEYPEQHGKQWAGMRNQGGSLLNCSANVG